LLRQGRKRLGPPDDATVAALKAIKDMHRLERLAEAVFIRRARFGPLTCIAN
jgi:hypothetical protein